MRTAFKLVAPLSSLLFLACNAHAQAPAASAPPAATSSPSAASAAKADQPKNDAAKKVDEARKANNEPPLLAVKCFRVLDDEALGGFNDGQDDGEDKAKQVNITPSKEQAVNRSASSASGATGSGAVVVDRAIAPCSDKGQRATLVGTGDVVVAVDRPDYEKMAAYQSKVNTRASLFVNGVNLDNDALVVSTDIVGDVVFIRYNVKPGEHSKKLWATLYRMGRTADRHPLRVGLGWSTGPTTDSVPQVNSDRYKIAITDPTSFWVAACVIVGLLVAGGYLAVRSDIFRDSKPPRAFTTAQFLRSETMHRPSLERTRVLRSYYADYDAADDPAYKARGKGVLQGQGGDVNDWKTIVGLAVADENWTTPKSTFSLGRTQLGLWFLFAVSAGSYLWIVYGDLPSIDNSLLGLLGLSLGVTGVSMAIDKDNINVEYRPSRGFLLDLVTGWDEQHQVHRFQAVVVNVLLLLVGVLHVIRHLSYPIFDPTWLALLGISGVALAAGKKITETPRSGQAATPPA